MTDQSKHWMVETLTPEAETKAAAAVLGGLNSLPGAIVGGLLLGLAESLAGGYLTVAFKNTLAFLIIIIILLVRPEGLLGTEFKERV